MTGESEGWAIEQGRRILGIYDPPNPTYAGVEHGPWAWVTIISPAHGSPLPHNSLFSFPFPGSGSQDESEHFFLIFSTQFNLVLILSFFGLCSC